MVTTFEWTLAAFVVVFGAIAMYLEIPRDFDRQVYWLGVFKGLTAGFEFAIMISIAIKVLS